MKHKIKIGIPRSLMYYKYGIFWKTYFLLLGSNVILSKETDENKINEDIPFIKNNICIPYKKYINHIKYLIPKCDYILSIKSFDCQKKCSKIKYINYHLNNLINKENILTINITNNFFHAISILLLGFKVTRNPLKIIYSYLYAKESQKQYNLNKLNEIKNKLTKQEHKILLISHIYNLEDKYLIYKLTKYLQKENIIVINSNYLDKTNTKIFSSYLPTPFSYNQSLSSELYYYKETIDGIIYIETNNCEIDSETYPLFLKNIATSSTKFFLEELNNSIKIETKLECLLDIIKNKF